MRYRCLGSDEIIVAIDMLCKKKLDKMNIYRGSCRIRIFVFLTLLRIFVPCLEILFCSIPRLASVVTLARGLRSWRGFTHGPFNNTANCPLRDYATQKRWSWNREGGEDKERDQRRLKQPPGRPGPAGQGRAERSRKYSSVRRESVGTSTVV